MTLKRDLVKYVRDKAKSKYNKGTECFICGVTENLDFHHYNGLTELLEIWLRKNKLVIKDESDILNLRERFIEEHKKELYEDAVTLCHEHHITTALDLWQETQSCNSKETGKMGGHTKRKTWHGMIEY